MWSVDPVVNVAVAMRQLEPRVGCKSCMHGTYSADSLLQEH